MKTIKTIFVPVLALLIAVNLHAQKSDKEKIKALKVAHITEQLDLTPKEAQAFWPIYNANEDANNKLRDNSVRRRLKALSIASSETEITEKEAKELLDKIVNMERSRQKIQHDYFIKLRALLSSKKILKLMNAERSFRRKMIKEFKERHRGDQSKR